MTDSTAIGCAVPLRIMIWIAEGTWPAAVDAARRIAPADAAIALLHVTAGDIEGAAHGAYTGLLGRGDSERDPGARIPNSPERPRGNCSTRQPGASAGRAAVPSSAAAQAGRSSRHRPRLTC